MKTTSTYFLEVGSHLSTPRFGYTHHGIYVGSNEVIHYSGLSDSLAGGAIQVVSLEKFCGADGFSVIEHFRPKFTPGEIVTRARSRLGENRYDVASNNCEHFVYWAIEGRCESTQVNRAVAPVAGGGATALGLAARGLVGVAGGSAGLTGAASTMAGLAAIGGTVVGGLAVLGGAGGVASASLINCTVLKDEVGLSNDERSSRSVGRKGSYVGAATGVASGIAAVAAGGTAGLSAAGITSGLAAVGGLVGGGMSAGIVVVTAAPAVAAIGAGYVVYRVSRFLRT
jgi:hypothetical protein